MSCEQKKIWTFQSNGLPFVSIVVAAYNAEKTISECIECLLALDYPDFEIIVVDNASTDATRTIVESYDVTCLLESKRGWPAARNRGIHHSNAEYVANIDADCFARNDWLMKLMLALNEPDIGGVVGKTEVRAGRTLAEHYYASLDPFNIERHIYSNSRFVPWGGGNNLYRKQVFRTVGYYDAEAFVSGADMEFHERLRTKSRYKMKYVPEAVIYHAPRGSVREFFAVSTKYSYDGWMRSRTIPDLKDSYRFYIIKRLGRLCVHVLAFGTRLVRFVFGKETVLRLFEPVFAASQTTGLIYGNFKARFTRLFALLRKSKTKKVLSRRTKILHFLGDLDVGGYEIGVARLLQTLNSEEFEYKLIVFEDGPMGGKLREFGIPYEVIPKSKPWDVSFLRRLFRVIRNCQPDIIHCTGVTPNVYGGIAALVCRVPAVIVIHGEQAIRDKIGARIVRTLGKLRAVRIVTVSNHLQHVLKTQLNLNGEHVTTIHNGIDLTLVTATRNRTELLNLPDDLPVIAAVGTLRPVKNLEDFVYAAHKLMQKGERAYFLIIGDGPERPKLEKLSSDLRMDSVVWFMGYRMDLETLWPAIDILVNSSTSEGISYVILEAMAAGIPVVATRVGGTPELVRDGHSGILVPPRNPNLLADAISELLLDVSKRKRMGGAGKKIAETVFSQSVSTRKYECLYRKLAPNSYENACLR